MNIVVHRQIFSKLKKSLLNWSRTLFFLTRLCKNVIFLNSFSCNLWKGWRKWGGGKRRSRRRKEEEWGNGEQQLWLRKGPPCHPISRKLKTIYKSSSVKSIKGGNHLFGMSCYKIVKAKESITMSIKVKMELLLILFRMAQYDTQWHQMVKMFQGGCVWVQICTSYMRTDVLSICPTLHKILRI